MSVKTLVPEAWSFWVTVKPFSSFWKAVRLI